MMVACFMATPVAAMAALSLEDDDDLLDPILLEVNNWHIVDPHQVNNWHIVDPHQEKMKAQQSKFMENINSTTESGLNDSSDAEERISDVANGSDWPAVSREVGLFKWRVLKQNHSH
ncbi:hypothetical protein HanPSC8_Chr10g0433561 [Helianthus annuus]|nr:hypothetical protein HanPSC8_Chr10g0433561 [Helianthus annuus]